MSRCPIFARHPEPFNARKRPHLAAALMKARFNGTDWIIDAPTGAVWFYRDARELVARGWGCYHQMRPDRLWTYRLTKAGVAERGKLWARIVTANERLTEAYATQGEAV